MFAGRAERNRGCDSVSVIILRCPTRGVSQLFLENKFGSGWRAGDCGAFEHGIPCPYY